ncbi:MAG TPA: glycosyltransferase family 2 protein [Flavobacteriaceae bacterium]|nr:glycosyltransferase family 2 protein [Flavobacteriaceae bacterium]
MKFHIIIPAHNEAGFIGKTLQSLVEQTFLPEKIVVVNDHSTDNTSEIVRGFVEKYPFISLVENASEAKHLPGSKVINAFYKGFETINDDYDVICKFDADLIFPSNYLATLKSIFEKDPKTGMAGGFCYIEKNGDFFLENLTNKDHIRGALKAYRKACFLQIGKLKPAMGWDTVDELLANYHGWKVATDESLHVKHLKPTGKTYTKAARFKQGEAFYKMRYGFLLTVIASTKLAFLKKDFLFAMYCLQGYFRAKKENLPFLVSEEEGEFIRDLRWGKIKEKVLNRNT